MHDGCAGSFESGQDVLHKIRTMGFNLQLLPAVVAMVCENCQGSFEMTTFEDKCPGCGMVYAVTPCHASDPASIRAAGIDV